MSVGARGIADIELIPARHVAPGPSARPPGAHPTETLEQTGSTDHVLRNCPLVSVLLDATVLQTSKPLIVAGEHDSVQETIEMGFAVAGGAAGPHDARALRPLEMHLQSLAVHFVYVVVTERVRRVAAASA